LWDKALDLKHFASFMQYAAEVNSFLPAAMIRWLPGWPLSPKHPAESC
jgi:hypothetical protein